MSKKSLLFLLFISFFILMTSCSSTIKTIKYSFSEFSIGSGGGATGFISGFTIDSSGKFFQWNGRLLKDNIKEMTDYNNDSVKAIEEIIEKSNLIDINYNKPDNFYRFFKIKSIDKENYLAWGLGADSDTTKNLNEIYEKIISIINNSK